MMAFVEVVVEVVSVLRWWLWACWVCDELVLCLLFARLVDVASCWWFCFGLSL